MKVAVIGATGLVGQTMLRVLEERKFPVKELIPVASSRSVGRTVLFSGSEVTVRSMEEAVKAAPDFAIFSAGGSVALEWAPRFAEAGSVVIDNSSAWRMEPEIPLVIPEVNGSILTGKDHIIANPNCSTIQLLMALAPLHRRYTAERVIVSTYQSVTGTGVKAVKQLENESMGIEGEQAYPHAIFNNCLPQCDIFVENGYTKEEMKLVNETRKILGVPDLKVTATAVRVPVTGGHSESATIAFKDDFEIDDVRALLDSFPGIIVLDNPSESLYPMPVTAKGRDEVFVGRIRRDYSAEKSLNLWIVSDNLRKGAATNAIQIAEYLAGMLKYRQNP
ncbi:MAG: aspartate-semialdehyde dehydrogenase [Bacteroidales bacterium]|nr:aspartate-semialdehyde dehydrogenase [Bacteroidales bacterium]